MYGQVVVARRNGKAGKAGKDVGKEENDTRMDEELISFCAEFTFLVCYLP